MRVVGAALILAASLTCVAADEFVDPPAFSANRVPLEILLVAREQKLTTLPGSPIGWVYEACLQKDAGKDARRCPGPGVKADNSKLCPTADDPAVSPYGGVRLQLARTQRLRIRLVNCLPAVIANVPHAGDFKHVGENGETLLQYNPTNLHTHGLIVEPRRADRPDESYGDYIFVLAINPANHPPPALTRRAGEVHGSMSMPHGDEGDHASQFDITPDGVINYDIDLVNHPGGAFWFHPHAHGLALNQVTAGLAGLITVGDVSQNLCGQKPCGQIADRIKVRHLLLKDTQLRIDGTLQLQEDTKFCGVPTDGSPDLLGKGFCPGALVDEDGGPVDYRGGKWYFTVNGLPDPTITVKPGGEIWRIANMSGSATYLIGLQDQASGNDIQVQVLSVDGVSIDLGPQTPVSTLQSLFADKLKVRECAPLAAESAAKPRGTPVCADRIRMMPSSRIDLWVTRRNAAGTPLGSASAALRTYSSSTGDAGDTWPGVELAHVDFLPASAADANKPMSYLDVKGEAKSIFSPNGALGQPAKTRVIGIDELLPVADLPRPSTPAATKRPGDATTNDAAIAARLANLEAPKQSNPCPALPKEKVRQIVFGLPDEDPKSPNFGLGYREIQNGQPLVPPVDAFDIKVFNHSTRHVVCLPLAAHGKPVTEQWELVNIAGEDHNFHIHQSRFAVISTQQPGSTGKPTYSERAAGGVLHDNVPLPRGAGCDGTVKAWKAGSCKPSRVIVDITFSEAGDFVFHCHILEHEDGGMMAKISVVRPAP